jgi:hydroxyethylthiazole kinase-like uncharacterized protein yjeF
MSPIPVLSPEQSADWDRAAETAGLALATLMESAGRAVAAVLAARLPHATGQGVLIAAGLGHNGGDGWVLARALHRAGVSVWVAPLAGERAPLTAHVAAIARVDGVREVPPDGPWPAIGLVVDALLGTGARGAPRPEAAALLERLLDLSLPLVAIDGPTGVDLLSGVVHGSPRADLTVTFGGVRRGHLLARDEIGDLVVVDIGHPGAATGLPLLVSDALAAEWLPPLAASQHKGDRGRVVVVGGAAGMTGAIRMSCRGAFASGAGLVHAVAPAETIAALAVAEPDVQTFVCDFSAPPTDALRELLRSADAVVIGPGLGRAAGRAELVQALVESSRTAVLDADALVVLRGQVDTLRRLAAERALVLTPHPGEFRSLFPELAGEREMDPWSAAAGAARASGCTVLLKGVPTVVAREGRAAWTVAAGNPGLATGGSGDLLSGIAGALLARGMDAHVAAALAAQTLGRGGDLAARRVTARAMRPMDVVAALPDLWREWAALRQVRAPACPPVLLELAKPRTL